MERSAPAGRANPLVGFSPSPDGHGFLVAWNSLAAAKDDHRTIEHHGPPWSADPTTTAWGVDSHVHALELSGSGRHLVAGCGAAHSRFTLWDTEGARAVAEASHEGPASWLGFTPDGLALISVRAPATPDLISSGAVTVFDPSCSTTSWRQRFIPRVRALSPPACCTVFSWLTRVWQGSTGISPYRSGRRRSVAI